MPPGRQVVPDAVYHLQEKIELIFATVETAMGGDFQLRLAKPSPRNIGFPHFAHQYSRVGTYFAILWSTRWRPTSSWRVFFSDLLGWSMPEAAEHESAKLIVTGGGLEPARRLRSRLRAASPGSRVRSTGFRGIFALEAEGDAGELAKLLWRECSQSIGHLTAILATVESRVEPIKEAAVWIGAAQIGAEESFCFRLHKRGAHGLEQDTTTLEQEIGGAIWMALQGKFNKTPKVRLKNAEVTVSAEILGPIAAVGISRRAWREQVQAR